MQPVRLAYFLSPTWFSLFPLTAILEYIVIPINIVDSGYSAHDRRVSKFPSGHWDKPLLEPWTDTQTHGAFRGGSAHALPFLA